MFKHEFGVNVSLNSYSYIIVVKIMFYQIEFENKITNEYYNFVNRIIDDGLTPS